MILEIQINGNRVTHDASSAEMEGLSRQFEVYSSSTEAKDKPPLLSSAAFLQSQVEERLKWFPDEVPADVMARALKSWVS